MESVTATTKGTIRRGYSQGTSPIVSPILPSVQPPSPTSVAVDGVDTSNLLVSARRKILDAGYFVGELVRKRNDPESLRQLRLLKLTLGEINALQNNVFRSVAPLFFSKMNTFASYDAGATTALSGCLDNVVVEPGRETVNWALFEAPKCIWPDVQGRRIIELEPLKALIEAHKQDVTKYTCKLPLTMEQLLAIRLYTLPGPFCFQVNAALWNPNSSVDLIANHFLFMKLLITGLRNLDRDVTVDVAWRGLRVSDNPDLQFRVDTFHQSFRMNTTICFPAFTNVTTIRQDAHEFSDEVLLKFLNVSGVDVSDFREVDDNKKIIVLVPPIFCRILSALREEDRLVISLEYIPRPDAYYLHESNWAAPESKSRDVPTAIKFEDNGPITAGHVEKLVDKVIESVNSNKSAVEAAVMAEAAVKNLTLAEAPMLLLNKFQCEKILASFLIHKSPIQCVNMFGFLQKDLLKFGTVMPQRRINHLQSVQAAQDFYEFMGDHDLIDQVDCNLLSNFKEHFKVEEGNKVDCIASLKADIEVNQSDWISELRARIASQSLVCMTGTGVSLGIIKDKRMSWNGLLDDMRMLVGTMRDVNSDDHDERKIQDADTKKAIADISIDNDKWNDLDPETKAACLQKVVSSELSHLDYRQFISRIARTIDPPANNHVLAVAISGLGLPIGTTNYDLVLETSLGRFERNLTKTSVHSLRHHSDYVYHVHGVWFDADSVVLSDRDYEATQHVFEYAISKLFFTESGRSHRSLLFIGCKDGMIDDHFKVLFRDDPRFVHLQHFALLRQEDIDSLASSPVFRRAVISRKLIPVCYGTKFDHLAAFISNLGSQVPEANHAGNTPPLPRFSPASTPGLDMPLPNQTVLHEDTVLSLLVRQGSGSQLGLMSPIDPPEAISQSAPTGEAPAEK
jgi:hypothetical protein